MLMFAFDVFLNPPFQVHGVTVETAPHELTPVDFGPALHDIELHVRGLVQAIVSLPSIDTLSKRYGGPGYVAGPSPPQPGLQLSAQSLQIEMVDSPMESFLQRIHQLWLDEKAEQQRREELFVLKIEALRRKSATGKSPMTGPQPSRPDGTGTGAATADAAFDSDPWGHFQSLSEDDLRRMEAQMRAQHSASYIQRVNALRKEYVQRNQHIYTSSFSRSILKKAPLMKAYVKRLSMTIGTSGDKGDLNEDEVVLRCIKSLHTAPECADPHHTTSSQRQPSVDRQGSNFSDHSNHSASGEHKHGSCTEQHAAPGDVASGDKVCVCVCVCAYVCVFSRVRVCARVSIGNAPRRTLVYCLSPPSLFAVDAVLCSQGLRHASWALHLDGS